MKKTTLLIKKDIKGFESLNSKAKIKELTKENKLKENNIHLLSLNIFLHKNNIIL